MGDVRVKAPEISTVMQRSTFEPKAPQSKAGAVDHTHNVARMEFRLVKIPDSIFAGEPGIRPASIGTVLPPKQKENSKEPESLQDKNSSVISKSKQTTNYPIHAQLAYKSNVVSTIGIPPQGYYGAVSSAFNLKKPKNNTFTFANGVFSLVGTVLHDLQVNLRPDDPFNITSKNDTDISSANYDDVVKDLTPDPMTNRSPRDQFWARDLTERHEKFHLDQQIIPTYGPDAVQALENWLNSLATSSWQGVWTALHDGFANVLLPEYVNFTSQPSTEDDAYADGAQEYQDRADSIKQIGDNGGYP